MTRLVEGEEGQSLARPHRFSLTSKYLEVCAVWWHGGTVASEGKR